LQGRGIMKGRSLVYLPVVALVTGCAPISWIQPSFGPSARVSVPMMDLEGPAVFLSDIRKPGGEPLSIPGHAFYLRPGKYFVAVICRRPFTEKDKTEAIQSEVAGSPGSDFSLTVEAGKQYSLDCDITDTGPQFILRDVTEVWLE
jgi:hypothetical protein